MRKSPSSSNLPDSFWPFPRKPRTEAKKNPAPYSLEQTRRWISFVQRDFWYKHQMPIDKNGLVQAVGMTAAHQKFTDSTLRKISSLIPSVTTRRIIFIYRRGRSSKLFPPFLWLDEAEPHHIPKLCKAEHWTLHAHCLSCGDNKFLPVMMGHNHVACYHCLPPSQYKSFGATLLDHSLINNAGKKIIAASQGLN